MLPTRQTSKGQPWLCGNNGQPVFTLWSTAWPNQPRALVCLQINQGQFQLFGQNQSQKPQPQPPSGPEVETFRVPVLGGEHLFQFPVVNLASWCVRQEELLAIAPTNPFAVVVLGQLARRATLPDQTRLVSKLELADLLKHWGYSSDKRFHLILVIDA